MYVVQASPFSRIFLPEFAMQLVENPELINTMKDPFTVRIPRATGGIELTHNKPVHINHLLPRGELDAATGKRTINREVEHDELRDLVPWLTGGADGMGCEETDIYGVVQLELATDLVADMVSARLEGRAPTSAATVEEQFNSAVDVALEKARKIANARVLRAIRITHKNLLAQWEVMATEGKGRYSPSVAEALGSHILAEEIEKATAGKRKMHEMLDKSLARSTHIGV